MIGTELYEGGLVASDQHKYTSLVHVHNRFKRNPLRTTTTRRNTIIINNIISIVKGSWCRAGCGSHLGTTAGSKSERHTITHTHTLAHSLPLTVSGIELGAVQTEPSTATTKTLYVRIYYMNHVWIHACVCV